MLGRVLAACAVAGFGSAAVGQFSIDWYTIDGGGGDFLSEDGKSLICRTHGAKYRLDDGYCFHGPCKGKSLVRLPLRVEGDGVHLDVPG